MFLDGGAERRAPAARVRWWLSTSAGALAIGSCALVASACALDDVDYTGKACPCPSPDWVCESDRCARPSASSCALRADDVRIGWTTPHSIRWQWTPVGDLDRLGSYRVRVGLGTGPDDAIGEPAMVTAADNPELGLARIPWTAGEDPVQGTITTGHEPDQPHWGQLEVIDDTGCVWTSPPQSRATKPEPPADRVPMVIFDDDLPAGSWLLPVDATVEEGADSSFDGSLRHLRWVQGRASTGQNLQIGGLGFPLDVVGVDGVDLQKTAYLEFAVALESNSNSHYSAVALQAAPEASGRHARLVPFTVRADGTYHVVEVALAGMAVDDGGEPFTGEDALQKFMFGCSPFELGAVLRVDSVKLRW